MAQDINKGNLYQAAERAKLSSTQKQQINSLADMYSTHTQLTNLPINVASEKFNQLPLDKKKQMALMFGKSEEQKPEDNRSFIEEAAYIISRPIVEPVKAVFKAANWASDQVTRAYRTGAIATTEGANLADAWQRSGANGEQTFNPDRIRKATKLYGEDRIYVAQQVAAGIPLDQILASAQNDNQKQIISDASQNKDKLFLEALAKVNASKYSPGRQIANALLPEDLEGSGKLYNWISGTADATFRLTLDPTLALGKANKAYLAGKYALTKTIGTAEKVEDSFKSPGVVRFWEQYTKSLDKLDKSRKAGGLDIGEATGELRRLNPGFFDNGVNEALLKFAKEDFNGVIDINTARAFLSDAERVEPLFFGQAGVKVKIMPRLSPLRQKRLDFYTGTSRIFDLNKDSASFLRNIAFDEADTQGITTAQAAVMSLTGRAGEDARVAGARTAERINNSTEIFNRKFSIDSINRRLDKATAKFALIPDSRHLGDFSNEKSVKAFGRYARFVYGRYGSRVVEDAYRVGDIGQRRNLFIGLQSTVGELRGLRATPGGRRLLDTLGNINKDAVYTNRIFDDLNPEGKVPSQINGVDSAAYVFQTTDRMNPITPEQFDKFGARDGILGKFFSLQYTDAADSAVSAHTAATLLGPRFPVRNAIEDYIFNLANGSSVMGVFKGRKAATIIRLATEDLDVGMINKLVRKKDRAKYIDELKTIDKTDASPLAREELKRKVLGKALLDDKFDDAVKGSFGSDYDRYLYEFATHGNYQNILKEASEGAYNVNAGNDAFSRISRAGRSKGKIVDFKIDDTEYRRVYGSFGTVTPIDTEAKIGWLFQLAAKATDEFGSKGMELLGTHGDNRSAFIKELGAYIGRDEFKGLRKRFDRYVDINYTPEQHAGVIYDDMKAAFSKADNSINYDLLGKFRKTDANGKVFIDHNAVGLEDLPKNIADLPRGIVVPKFVPASQSKNLMSDFVSRLWDWSGDANARMSRDPIVLEAAFSIRKDMQGYLDDLTEKIGKEAATQRVIELSEDLAVERVLAFVDNPAVRTQLAWSMRNFARFYRATEDAYRRLGRTARYNPEALRKASLVYDGVAHSGFVQRDDQGEPYFVYPGTAGIYNAMNKTLNVFGLGDKFTTPMPLQFGSSLKMLTPSANPDSWLPTFSGPLAGLTMKTIYGIAGFFQESDIPVLGRVGKEIASTERFTLGPIGEDQPFINSMLPGHVNRLIGTLDRDERDSQYASAFRKAVTYLEAGGHTPSAGASPGEKEQYQRQLKATIATILGIRFVLGFASPASPTIQLKSDMADWVKDNNRVNFKQVWNNLIKQYEGTPNPVGRAVEDWVKYFPDQIPFMVNESEPIFNARFKTSQQAAAWVQDNKKLVDAYPEGSAYLIPTSGDFSFDAYQTLRDNGYTQSKPVGDFLQEVFVSRAKNYFYSQQDIYEKALENASTDRERKMVNESWSEWSKEYKQTRPLLQLEFAESASKTIKRQQSYSDLKTMLDNVDINTPAAQSLRKMVRIYDEYKVNADTVYNSSSDKDINTRQLLRESTLLELKDIAETNPNAASAFETLFAQFLRD